ncbi:MAG TPA: polysaccharide biosynthesis C-terminal domain-containing protein [Solirubrobacteraceae bacterium]|nr:polysaccharide biosynthesis C-terminal domain-containing protein [Solirubrobacteraceae bacterium]
MSSSTPAPASPRRAHSRSPATLAGGRITRHTIIYVLGTLAVGPFSIFSVVVLTRLLPPVQYGELALLFVFAGFLTTIYNIGSLHGTFMWVYGASEGDAGDDVESGGKLTTTPRRALGTGVAITLAIVSAGTLVCFVLAPTLSRLLLSHSAVTSIRWAAASAATGSLWRLTVNVFRMERRPITFSTFNALRPLFAVAGSVPLVALGYGVNGALAGTALGTLLAVVIAVAIARRSYALAFSWSDAAEITRRGARVVVPVVMLYVVHSADIVLLSHYAAGGVIGVYRVASRFATVPSYFASAFLMAWAPMERGVLFQATYRERGRERTKASLLTYYLVAGVTLVVLLDVAANGLVLLAGEDYRSAAPLIPLIGLAFVAYGLYVVLVRVIPAERRMLWYSIGAIIAALVQIGLSVILIPWLGAYGAPLATLAGLALGCMLWVSVVTRVEHAPFPFELGRLAGLAAIVAALAAVQALGETLWPAGRAAVLALVVLAYPALIWKLRVIPREHVRPLLGLARAAIRERVGTHNPTERLPLLDADTRELLTSLTSGRVALAALADRRGVTHERLHADFTAAVRELTELGPSRPELDAAPELDARSKLDAQLGAYLLSPEPEAQRDVIASEIIEAGVDPLELIQLDEAVKRLQARPATRRRWTPRKPVRGAGPVQVPVPGQQP